MFGICPRPSCFRLSCTGGVLPKRPCVGSRPPPPAPPDRAAVVPRAPPAMPRRLESFSDWVKSENYQLRQKGHVYRVSEQPAAAPVIRKSVRFNDPPVSASPPPGDRGRELGGDGEANGAYVSFERPSLARRRPDGSLV